MSPAPKYPRTCGRRGWIVCFLWVGWLTTECRAQDYWPAARGPTLCQKIFSGFARLVGKSPTHYWHYHSLSEVQEAFDVPRDIGDDRWVHFSSSSHFESISKMGVLTHERSGGFSYWARYGDVKNSTYRDLMMRINRFSRTFDSDMGLMAIAPENARIVPSASEVGAGFDDFAEEGKASSVIIPSRVILAKTKQEKIMR